MGNKGLDAALESVVRAAATVAGSLPAALKRALAGRPIRSDGQVLDAEVQLMLKMLALLPDSDFEQLPLERSRAQIDMESRLVSGRPIPMASVETLSIPGPAGPIPARMFRPRGLPTSAPLLVYFHGGGFVLGSLDSHDSVCRFLARHADVAVLAVDYRLAPEHAFPAAVDDGSRRSDSRSTTRTRSASIPTGWPSPATARAAISPPSWPSSPATADLVPRSRCCSSRGWT